MRRQTKGAVILTTLLSLCITACGGVLQKPGQPGGDSHIATYAAALKTGAIIYEQGMSLCRDLYEAGAIDKSLRDKVVAVAWRYWASYHAAQKALEHYARLRNSQSYASLLSAMASFYADREELGKYVAVLAKKEKP